MLEVLSRTRSSSWLSAFNVFICHGSNTSLKTAGAGEEGKALATAQLQHKTLTSQSRRQSVSWGVQELAGKKHILVSTSTAQEISLGPTGEGGARGNRGDGGGHRFVYQVITSQRCLLLQWTAKTSLPAKGPKQEKIAMDTKRAMANDSNRANLQEK